MPHRRFDWHEHIKDIEGEFRAARMAVDRLKAQIVATPRYLKDDDGTRAYLRKADKNLEGTGRCLYPLLLSFCWYSHAGHGFASLLPRDAGSGSSIPCGRYSQ
jgi:hypothetical protein